MDTRAPLPQRIEALLSLAAQHSRRYAGVDAQLARARYRAEHPTQIMALKCMDGRIHLPHVTRTPMGIIQPFRNLGGIFDLGWPYLGELITQGVAEARHAGQCVLLLVTYHYSQGSPDRGCAGFGGDVAAARDFAQQLKAQAMTLFSHDGASVYPLVCGFETDSDALLVHGDDGDILDMRTLAATQNHRIDDALLQMFPYWPVTVRNDLAPLLRGNLAHVHALRQAERRLDIDHREWAICIGRGFDFLHLPNTALIVGPYSPDLAAPVATAARIIAANMVAGRIPDDGALLLASVPYERPGGDRARAEMKSRFLTRFAMQTLGQSAPELLNRLVVLTGVVHWPTRHLEVLARHSP